MLAPAPIVLFAYNRPNHTLKTLESLKRNELAASSELTIVCDGARPDAQLSELENIRLVRRIAKSENWCGKTTVIENSINEKLPNILPRVLNEMLEKNDRVIVLEDDLLLSTGFLKYMNEALETYKDEERVMHISGFIYPVKARLDETSFLILSTNWGWGTWKRAWKKFISDPLDLLSKFSDPEKKYLLNVENTHDYFSVLKKCANTSWKSWDIRWYATVVYCQGLCLHPHTSLVRNIGNDDSGVNCGEDDTFQLQPIVNNIEVRKIPIQESKRSRAAIRKFYLMNDRKDFKSRMKIAARKILPPVIPIFFSSNKTESVIARRNLRSVAKLFVPHVFRKTKKSETKNETKEYPSSESYWSEHLELLEYWGEGNVWNEIECLLSDKSGKVLDIACGTGTVIKLLQKYRALDVYGVDNNKFLIDKAKEKDISETKLFIRDATELSVFTEKEFSFSYSIGLIYYFDDVVLEKFISENARVTKNGSYHFILCNRGIKDEEWIYTWQNYRNNSAGWWKAKFENYYSQVRIINSSWRDDDYKKSKGIWLICEK